MNNKTKILQIFLNELSIFLNRDQTDIIQNGLFFTDFKNAVKLIYEDGSYIYYRYAFLVKNDTQIGVFTEHCGYHIYDLNDFDDYIISA